MASRAAAGTRSQVFLCTTAAPTSGPQLNSSMYLAWLSNCAASAKMGTVGTALMVPDNRPCGMPVASRATGLNPLAFHKSYSAALSDRRKP